jgi:hypothetical protein
MIRAILLAAAVLLTTASPVPARAEVPVRVRIIKGSRQGPASIDPKLEDLKRQLSHLAYQRWEQVQEKDIDLTTGKVVFVSIPGGDEVGVTLQEKRGQTLTIEVALAQRNTQSRLTIDRTQRIVHQITGEKGGSAYFLTVRSIP